MLLMRPLPRLGLRLLQPVLLALPILQPLPWVAQMPVRQMLQPPRSGALRALQMRTAFQTSSSCWRRLMRASAGPALR